MEDTAGEEFEPYDHRDRPVNTLTKTWQTLMHFLKGSVGTGILAMHVAFSNSGILVGIIGTVFFTVICCYAMQLMIRSQYLLCKKKRVGLLTYADAMEYALQTGPERTQKYSRIGYYSVDIFLLIFQLGVCSVYIVFIANNMQQFIQFYAHIDWSVRVYCLIVFLPILCLNMLRNYRVLAPFATVANFCTIIGLGFILSFVFRDLPGISERPMVGPFQRFPMYMGTVLFALLTIGVITSLENNMLKPAEFVKPFGVLNVGFFIIMLLYMTMGLFGYIKYGYREKLQGSITLEIPNDDLLAQSVKLIFSIAITVSHPVQCFVAIEVILDKYMKKRMESSQRPLVLEYIVRICIVFVTLIFALSIPMLGEFINLLGTFCLSALGFVFPPIMDMLARYPDKLGKMNWVIYKDILIIIFGIISCVVGTYACVLDIVVEFKKQSGGS